MTDENSRGVETRWQKEKGFYLSKVESLYNIKRGDKGNFICVLGKYCNYSKEDGLEWIKIGVKELIRSRVQ